METLYEFLAPFFQKFLRTYMGIVTRCILYGVLTFHSSHHFTLKSEPFVIL
jgi:hypothetical protein